MQALGGTVIHEGRDARRGLSGPYVRLADAITDPGTSLQVPWGFTTARVPGDNRG